MRGDECQSVCLYLGPQPFTELNKLGEAIEKTSGAVEPHMSRISQTGLIVLVSYVELKLDGSASRTCMAGEGTYTLSCWSAKLEEMTIVMIIVTCLIVVCRPDELSYDKEIDGSEDGCPNTGAWSCMC